MSDLVVRYVAGQFVAPNKDNVYKRSPSQDVEIHGLNIQNTVIGAYIIQQAKGLGSAVVSRVGDATGNRALGRNLSFVSTVLGDIATIGTGAAAGGPVGFGITVAAVGFQKGLQAYDIGLERRRATLDSDEQARRAGFVQVDKRSEHR